MNTTQVVSLLLVILGPPSYYLFLMRLLGGKGFFREHWMSLTFFAAVITVFSTGTMFAIAFMTIIREVTEGQQVFSVFVLLIVSPAVMAILNKYYLRKENARRAVF